MSIGDSKNIFVYLRKSDNHKLCLALSNTQCTPYNGFQFEPYQLNLQEHQKLYKLSETKTFKIFRDCKRPNFFEIILLDDIEFPEVERKIELDNCIFCFGGFIKQGPIYISDSGITAFITRPAEIFRNLEFLIYPTDASTVDLWSMDIYTQSDPNFV